jgi:hypothetical protein
MFKVTSDMTHGNTRTSFLHSDALSEKAAKKPETSQILLYIPAAKCYSNKTFKKTF